MYAKTVVMSVEIRVDNHNRSLLLMMRASKVYSPKLNTVKMMPMIRYLLACFEVLTSFTGVVSFSSGMLILYHYLVWSQMVTDLL